MDEAIGHYEQAVVLDPTQPRPQVRLGGLYASQGRLAEAEAAYRAALGSDPESPTPCWPGRRGLSPVQRLHGCAVHAAAAAAGRPATVARWRPTTRPKAAALTRPVLYAELADAPAEDVFAHLAVADYLLCGYWPDEAAQAYQQILEAGAAAPGLVISPFTTRWARSTTARSGSLRPAASSSRLWLPSWRNVARCRPVWAIWRCGPATPLEALAVYDVALAGAPQYLAGLPAENSAVTRLSAGTCGAQPGPGSARGDGRGRPRAGRGAGAGRAGRESHAALAAGPVRPGRDPSGVRRERRRRCGFHPRRRVRPVAAGRALGRLEQGLASLQAGE